jgi:predicted permease
MPLLPKIASLWKSIRVGRVLDEAGSDLRHARRMIGRSPGLALVVVLSLGAGIGVNTAVFSWIEAIVLRPLPGVRDAGEIHLVEPRASAGSHPGASWLEYRDLRERLHAVTDLAAFRMVPLNLGEAGRTERVYGLLVSDNYFAALGVRPVQGSVFPPEAPAAAAADPVAVVSHEFWRTRLGQAPDVVGRTIRVNDRTVAIAGVAPEGFQGTVIGLAFDVWMRAALAPTLLPGSRELEDRSQRGYAVIGRIAPPATRASAQAELSAAMHDLATLYPASNAGVEGEVRPFWSAPRGPQLFLVRALWILQGVLLLLLLAVCGNTANLVLARASVRQREIGVRMTLGAGPGRVVRLLLSENLLLGLLGSALGAVVAAGAIAALRAIPMTGALPIKFQTRLDGPSLAFAMLLGIACGLAFGLAPALQLARTDPQRALRSGARAAGRSRLRNVLMATEVALALMVLVAAGLFLKSFQETRETDAGFRRDGVLLAAYDLTGRGADEATTRTFAARLLDEVRALPGVQSAAIAAYVPLDIHGLPLRAFTLEGRAAGGTPDQALTNVVTPGYFQTMGIPLRAGADFVDMHDATIAPQAIVNEQFVRRYVAGGEAIGRRLSSRGRTYVIAGVVADSLYESFSEPRMPALYLSYRDRPWAAGEVHVRTTAGTELAVVPELRRIVRGLDPMVPVFDVRTLSEHVEKNLVFRRIPARLFAVLGPLLLVLAAIGIYAVVAYSVAQRTTEIGVRLALGGGAARIVRGIVGETMRVVGIGAFAGWAIAMVVALHLARRGSLGAPVVVGVPAMLLAVAAGACWLPARRAARIDPVAALRDE